MEAFKIHRSPNKKRELVIGLIIVGVAVLIISSMNSKPSASPAAGEIPRTTEEVVSDEVELNLVSMRCYWEYDYYFITGEVKNVTNRSLENVAAVGSVYSKDEQFISSDETLIKYSPILAGQTSPFQVMLRYNPEMKDCKLSFKYLFGGTINSEKSPDYK